ncbi:unnamed protein product, partial [Polarella glacialis]
MALAKGGFLSALLATVVGLCLLVPAQSGAVQSAGAGRRTSEHELKDAEEEHKAPEKKEHGEPAQEEHGAPAEGGEHGEPAEGGEHGEPAEHHVTETTLTASILLFGFLIFDIVLLYLVNWADPNVRSYMYKMISTTVSIFSAVLLNQAIRSIVLEQILCSPFPRGFNITITPTIEILVGLAQFVTCFTGVNVACWYFRKSLVLHAVEVIGGHLTAFSGVAFFGHIQEVCEESKVHVAVVFLAAIVFMVLCRALSYNIRKACFDDNSRYATVLHESINAHESNDAHESHNAHAESHWLEAVVEAEDDAAGIILSFLMAQALAYYIADFLPPLEGPGSRMPASHWKIIHLFDASLLFLAGLMMATWAHQRWMKKQNKGHENHEKHQHRTRFFKSVQHFLAMSMSWCLLLSAIWSVSLLNLFKNAHMTFVLAAFIVTALSVLCVIALDVLADLLDSFEGHESRKTELVASPEGDDDANQFGPSSAALDNMEQVVRMIIGAFGLLVGLSWEKAFD